MGNDGEHASLTLAHTPQTRRLGIMKPITEFGSLLQETTMENRDLDLYADILRERQEEMLRELKQDDLLRDHTLARGTRRKLLISVAAVTVLVIVAVATGAQFFV